MIFRLLQGSIFLLLQVIIREATSITLSEEELIFGGIENDDDPFLINERDIFAYFAKKDDGNVEHATTTGPYINTKADRKNMTQRIYSHQSAGLKIALPPRPEQLELQSLKIRDDETKDIENNSEVKQSSEEGLFVIVGFGIMGKLNSINSEQLVLASQKFHDVFEKSAKRKQQTEGIDWHKQNS